MRFDCLHGFGCIVGFTLRAHQGSAIDFGENATPEAFPFVEEDKCERLVNAKRGAYVAKQSLDEVALKREGRLSRAASCDRQMVFLAKLLQGAP